MSTTHFNISISKEITGRTLQFETIQSIQEWLQQEQKAFQWVSQVGNHFSRNVWSHINSQFQGLTNQVNALNQSIIKMQPFDGNLNAINSWFTTTYSKNRKLILSTSSEFKAVSDLKNNNLIQATIFLGHILKIPNLYSNGIETTDMIEGSFHYFQYSEGLSKKDLSAERQALNELKKEWDQHLTDYKSEEDKLKVEFNTVKTNFDDYFKTTQDNIHSHSSKHTTDLDELKKTYNQYMSLKAPVDYWSQKRDEHVGKVSSFRNWTLCVGCFGGSGLLWAVHHVFSDGIVNYWKIGFFILTATLYFWVMRVLVKLLMSNIHLEGDANERVVMSQTYLALIREQSGLSDNDKKLILATLFRPGSSGIVGDDGIPPGFYDMVTKLVSK